jgi:hypothetical protein
VHRNASNGAGPSELLDLGRRISDLGKELTGVGRASTSNCSCLLAAMFNSPSPVQNVPEGLAVTFSLLIGSGFTLGSASWIRRNGT